MHPPNRCALRLDLVGLGAWLAAAHRHYEDVQRRRAPPAELHQASEELRAAELAVDAARAGRVALA